MHPLAHPLATPMVVDQITDGLGDRSSFPRTMSIGMRDLLASIPNDRRIMVEAVRVHQMQGTNIPRVASVEATLEGVAIVATYYICDDDSQRNWYARLKSEPAIPLRTFNGPVLFDLKGDMAAAEIVDVCEFEYGGGAVRYGNDPLRFIDCWNTTYDRSTGILHMNGLSFDLAKAEISKIDPEGDALSYMVDGVPLHLAMDLNFPDGETLSAVKDVDNLIERLSSGVSTRIEIEVDGIRSIIGRDDIIVTRQPMIDDVIDLDPSTLEEPVRLFLEDLGEIDGFEQIKRMVDQDAGSVIHAKLGDTYAFEFGGREGIMHPGDELYDFSGMDMYGRMVTIREIAGDRAREPRMADVPDLTEEPVGFVHGRPGSFPEFHENRYGNEIA